MCNDIYHVISCLPQIKIYLVNAIFFMLVAFIFFKPKSGLKKGILLIISYKPKHPINVNATTRLNLSIVGNSRGRMIYDPRYKKTI